MNVSARALVALMLLALPLTAGVDFEPVLCDAQERAPHWVVVRQDVTRAAVSGTFIGGPSFDVAISMQELDDGFRLEALEPIVHESGVTLGMRRLTLSHAQLREVDLGLALERDLLSFGGTPVEIRWSGLVDTLAVLGRESLTVIVVHQLEGIPSQTLALHEIAEDAGSISLLPVQEGRLKLSTFPIDLAGATLYEIAGAEIGCEEMYTLREIEQAPAEI